MAELTTNINYLQPTAFKLVIDRKKFGNLEYFAQAVNHPSVSVAAAELQYKRVNLHMAGDKLTFNELTATIILDENLSAYSEMYDWMKRLVESPNQTRTFGEDGDYSTAVDITLSVLSSKNNAVKQIRYIDCVPTELGDISFEATTQDVQMLTFPISFRFSYFELV